jgi:hypothetical protein
MKPESLTAADARETVSGRVPLEVVQEFLLQVHI